MAAGLHVRHLETMLQEKKTIYCVFKNENYTYCSKILTLRLLGTEDSRLVFHFMLTQSQKFTLWTEDKINWSLCLSAFHTHKLNLTYINICYCTVTFTSEWDFLTSMNKFLSQTSMRVRLNITNSFINILNQRKKKNKEFGRDVAQIMTSVRTITMITKDKL